MDCLAHDGWWADRTLAKHQVLALAYSRNRQRNTAHASLAVFMSRNVNTPKLLLWHEGYHSAHFPRHRVTQLSLVQYRFHPSFEVVTRHLVDL